VSTFSGQGQGRRFVWFGSGGAPQVRRHEVGRNRQVGGRRPAVGWLEPRHEGCDRVHAHQRADGIGVGCRSGLAAYVSSVDSGNLAGHLIALANACEDWATPAPDKPDAPPNAAEADVRAGLMDTLRLARAGCDHAENSAITGHKMGDVGRVLDHPNISRNALLADEAMARLGGHTGNGSFKPAPKPGRRVTDPEGKSVGKSMAGGPGA
jgi:hypothetical protein